MERIELFGKELYIDYLNDIYDEHECYAVINENGEILRYCETIGKKEDIVYLDR